MNNDEMVMSDDSTMMSNHSHDMNNDGMMMGNHSTMMPSHSHNTNDGKMMMDNDSTMMSNHSHNTNDGTMMMNDDSTMMHDKTDTMENHAKMYACPMHSEITGKKNEECSKCGMKLTKLVPEKRK